MAYTNVWTTAVPTGAEALNTADNEIRKLRLDLEERMDSLGLDWGADPVTGTSARLHYMPWSFFFAQSIAVTIGYGAPHYGISAAGTGTNVLYAPIILPRGAILDGLTLSGATGPGSTLTAALLYVDTTTGTPAETSITSVALSASTAQTNKAADPFSHTIDSVTTNFRYYLVKITMVMGGGNQVDFQGVRLSYTNPQFGGI